MRAETRHQLKQDQFSRATMEAAGKTVDWTVEHRSKLVMGAAVGVAVIAIVIGAWYYLDHQDQKASVAFGEAVRTLDTYVRPAGTPAQADFPSFGSYKERNTEAQKKFQAVVDNYPHTRSAEFAHYFLGTTSAEAGNNAAAERELRTVAGAGNKDLAALGKMALASVYRNTSRNKEAIGLYKQLIDHPTRSVSKVMAQIELAATYQSDQQPLEAKKIYEQVQKENPASSAAQTASAKLQELK